MISHICTLGEQGIEVLERVPIPEDMIPADAHVEIDAKVHAGYHGGDTHQVTDSDLSAAKGRKFEGL